MTDLLTILNGDCVEQMRKLPDESVQCVVTSPPYDRLRTYGHDLKWDFEATAKELYRLLVPGGVLCWNVNDAVEVGSETLTSCEQKIFFRRGCGFLIHDTMIYHKTNFSHPESVRYHQVFEYVFILSKGTPRAWNPIKDKPNAYAGTGTYGANTARQADGSMTTRPRNIITVFGMRGNVWTGKTRGQEEICKESKHPAAMPRWLARDLITSWSNTGDTVLDPFAGGGTTGSEALKLARRAILIEKNPEYIAFIESDCNITPGLAI